MRDADVVVLGGGPAGLAAAMRAAGTGRSVLLLERGASVGGMAASFEVAGIRVDSGSHRLHPATPPAVLGRLRELLGADLQTRPRHGRLRVYGRWVGFPLRPAELARTLPPAAVARIARDAATRPLTRTDPSSYESVLVGTLGPELHGALYGPYAEKLWGLPGQPDRPPSRPAGGSAPPASGASPARSSAGTPPARAGSSTTRAAASARSSTCSPRPRRRPARRSRPGPRSPR